MQDASAAHSRAPFPTLDLCKEIRQAAGHRCSLAAFFGDMIDAMFLSTMNGIDRSEAWHEREAAYLAISERHPKAAMDVMVKVYAALTIEYRLLRSDPLGSLYMELGLGDAGQVFTPWNVSRMTAEITLGGDRSGIAKTLATRGYVTINDPASGSGCLAIAAASAFSEMGHDPSSQMLITTQDISEDCWKMTWLAMTLAGLAGVAIHGDALDQDANKQSAVTPAGRVLIEREMMETKGEGR